MKDVTVVITACGRTDLLEYTLESFFKYNTYPISKMIIVEDSGKPQDFSKCKSYITCPVEFIINETNLGQMKSIDKAYAKVETDYIFHCEEDWLFLHSGFIEKSFEILDYDPKIFTVWLRSYHEKKIGPAVDKSKKVELPSGGYFHYITVNEGKPWQCGFTLNPGLRRTKDCMLLHPYNDLDVLFPKTVNLVGERDLAVHYKEKGFRGAITDNEYGYIEHIGGKRHVTLPWEM